MRIRLLAAIVAGLALAACDDGPSPIANARDDVTAVQNLVQASCGLFLIATDVASLVSRSAETAGELAGRVCDQVNMKADELDAELAAAEAEFEAKQAELRRLEAEAERQREEVRQAACAIDPNSDDCLIGEIVLVEAASAVPPHVDTTITIDCLPLNGSYFGRPG